MSALLDALALVVVAAGLVAGAAVVARTGRWLEALHAALDFWVAAGVLRLSGEPTWDRLAGAAAVVAIRQLVGFSLRQAEAARTAAAGLARPAWRR